jgi:DNA repair exonuclease SbcCD ATPase subunit
MQRVVRVSVKNILLHKDSSLYIRQKGGISVYGENKDEVLHKESNGSGKTTIIEPFFVCFLGKTSRGCSLKKIIRRGEDSGVCEIEMVDDNNIVTIITVNIHKNKPTRCVISVNGEVLSYLLDMKIQHSFSYIQDTILGISAQDLSDFYLISSESKATFLSAGTSNKDSVISRFSNITEVDTWVENIKLKIKNKKIQIAEEQLCLSKSEGEYHTLCSIIERNNAIISENTNSDTIVSDSKKRVEHYENLHSVALNSLRKIEIEIENYNDTNISQIDSKVRQYNDKVSELSSKNNELLGNISQAKFTLSNHHVCPKCSTKFTEKKSNLDLEKISKYISSANLVVNENLAKISAINLELNKEKANLTALRQEIIKLKQQKSIKENEIREIKGYLDAYIKADSKILNEINAKNLFRESVIKSNEGLINNDLKNITEIKESLHESINNLNQQLQRLEFWKSEILEFKSFLSKNALLLIENSINAILTRISSHNLRISETKITTSGVEKKETNCFIDGFQYSEFSGGEKGRIDVASFIAFRELINSKSSNGLDILVIDEALDKVDRVGIYSIMKTLDSIGISSVVISHVKVDGENSVKVIRENDEAKLIYI